LQQDLKKIIYILFSFWLMYFFVMPVKHTSCTSASYVGKSCCSKKATSKSCCSKKKAATNKKTCNNCCGKSTCICSSAVLIVAVEQHHNFIIEKPTTPDDGVKYPQFSSKEIKGFTNLWTLPKIG
jgi:hypothetical protein